MIEGAQEGELATQVFGTDQWLEFVGHLHPLVLHMPIGLLAASLLLEFVSLFSRGTIPARRVVHAAFGLSAVVAAVTGWLLADTGGYGSSLVDEHRNLAIVAAVLGVIVALVDLFGRDGTAAFARRLALFACAATLTLAGHSGGMITHGRTFLSAVAPPELAPWLGEEPKERRRKRAVLPPTSSEPESLEPAPERTPEETPEETAAPAPSPEVSDVAILVEAFRARCFECHQEDKVKGDLRLDVVSGWPDQLDLESPEDSEMLYRVLLPRDDADAMPPKGDALDPGAIDALRRWIESGAPMDELERQLSGASEDEQQAAADLDDVRAMTGARIASIAADLGLPSASRRLDVSWRHVDVAPDATRLAALGPVASRVVDLDLAGRSNAAAALAGLPPMEVLERLHLERTDVDSEAVEAVCRAAPALRYVNVHSTEVCGAALEPLAELEHLERLVLFDTRVTADEVDSFEASRPGVRATLGAALMDGSAFGSDQPRRILAADPDEGRVALLREIAIGKPEVLWERPIEGLDAMEWRGDTSGGHGRVLLAEGDGPAVVVDTATDTVVETLDAFEDDGTAPVARATLASGHRVEARPCQAPDDPQLVEVQPDGDIEWAFHDPKRFRGDGARFILLDGDDVLSLRRQR
ncbi:MAG: c-type cytochrome domain-containing protein [Planctomycetota bacterium]